MNFKPKKIILVLLTLLCFITTATAYNIQYADGTAKTSPLRWKTKKIPVSFSKSLLNQTLTSISEKEILEAINNSLAAWENVANIKFVENWSENNSVSPLGKNGDAVNLVTIAQTGENLLLFSGEASENAARTRVFFDRQGNITEADIVLNPYTRFSTDGSVGTYDLEAVLTHEIGHLLGLEHSDISAATMFEHQGKNGIYNLKSFSPRTLSNDDIAGVRSLYGANDDETNCCGTINGKISVSGKSSSKKFKVFAEDSKTGKFIADVSTDDAGNFIFEGLTAGDYILYSKSADLQGSAVEVIGKAEVLNGKTVTVNKRLKSKQILFDLQFAGFNGQLANLAVPLNSGKSYKIYLAGKNLDVENLTATINSPFIKVNSDSIKEHDYGKEVSVISFDVILDANVPNGDYSISLSDKNGNTDYLFGCLSVEEMKNPWYTYTF